MKVTIRQKSGMQYLYADVNVSGIRAKSTLGISVKEGKFNLKKQVVQGVGEVETNILINTFKSEILSLIRTLQQKGELSSANIINGINEIRLKLTDPDFSIDNDQRIVFYAERFIQSSEGIRKPATLKQLRNTLVKLKKYEQVKKVKLTFDKTDLTFYNSLVSYCITDLNPSTNSIGNIIKNLKTFFHSAFEEGVHENLIYRSRYFKKPSEESEAIYLSEAELQRMKMTILPNRHLDNVRDLFLLACYTGVRSQDYNKLNNDSLINNGTMLKVRTEKTDEEVIIPLHPIAKAILEKYNGTPRIISNQKFNEYIKDVCRIVGLTESVTISRTCGGKKTRITKPKYNFVSSHTARRSFATNAYKAGVPTLAIMAITGHRTEKVFLKYVKVTKEEHAKIVGKHGFFGGNVA
jgi:integrase